MIKQLLYTTLFLCSHATLHGMQNINSLEKAEIMMDAESQVEYTVDHSLDEAFIKQIKDYQAKDADLASIESMLNRNTRPDINVTFNYMFTNEKRECTPLIFAATVEDLDLLKLLIKNKADLNTQNAQGLTALMAAIDDIFSTIYSNAGYAYRLEKPAVIRRLKVIDALVKARADMQAQDNEGKSAFSYAAEEQYDNNMFLRFLLYQTYTQVTEANLKEITAWAQRYYDGPLQEMVEAYRQHCQAALACNQTLQGAQPIINSAINQVNVLGDIIVDYAQTTAADIRQQRLDEGLEE